MVVEGARPIILATPEMHTEARENGLALYDFHRRRRSPERHPKKTARDCYLWGALGELVVRKWLAAMGVLAEYAPLFTENLVDKPPWDVRFYPSGKTADVKAIPPDDLLKRRTRMLVNQREVHDVDYYIGVKFWTPDKAQLMGWVDGKPLRESAASFNVTEPAWAREMTKLIGMHVLLRELDRSLDQPLPLRYTPASGG